MKNSRRNFIKQSAACAGVFTIVPSHVLFSKPEIRNTKGEVIRAASLPPSDKINIAYVGIGNRAVGNMKYFRETGMVNVVALCDVDMGAAHTLASMEEYPDAPRFQDFRKMLDKMKGDIDAVCISTPDFSHFPATILSMSEGKHVYVEKPLARTFQEVELLMKAEKKYKVVTQMGNQGHSGANYFQFKAWFEAGIIKDVTKITAHMNLPRRWHGWDTSIKDFPVGQPLPSTLDWDTWLSASQYIDYHPDFVNGQWRSWYKFGMGTLGDWGAHIIDTAHRFLELGLPEEIDPVKLDGFNPFFFPQASTLAYKFPKRGHMPPVTIHWHDGVENIPQVPAGYGKLESDPDIPPPGNGAIQPSKLPPGKIIYSKDLIFKGGTHNSTLSIIPSSKELELAGNLPEYPTGQSYHYANFLLACKGMEESRSPFKISGPLSQVFCLGVIAQRLNTKLTFDRKKKKFKNNKLANHLLADGPPRKGWEEFYKL